MGVPRLFKMLVERYPQIYRSTQDQPIPEFDNFYLDFNGLFLVVSHIRDHPQLLPWRVPFFGALQRCLLQLEIILMIKEVMMMIFSFVELIFSIVKPKSLLFIAVDGVAPRAKMNQQRQRRFHAAKACFGLVPVLILFRSSRRLQRPLKGRSLTPTVSPPEPNLWRK